ncbi:MAG: hypothetical protein M0R34_01510 [Candidatus Marinimicrobia bacterium]|jgi:Tol biopolymer transport system component|nr:hypothetical protein [Candidatus Neomarinimicrobiota bacterium]MCK9559193.1 hypothetical protein [Candidatus Neomarinimicrobiota bacterium]
MTIGRLKYRFLLVFSLFLLFFFDQADAQFGAFNHAELKWLSFETAHFKIHYHEGAEWTMRRAAEIAETIYGPVTEFYQFEPSEKTALIIRDTDDISNGAAYYYDNKIEIWATPLDFPFRGNHDWLRDVITHEFTHIVSLQKAMKFGRSVPAFYIQVLDNEPEKREDVVYGYPRVIASYPIPGMVIPMWLAEGMAQSMFPGNTNDSWDTHRDMLLRDRVLNKSLLSLTEMGSFGKRGTGNESVYNHGYAFTLYLAERFGSETIPRLAEELSKPLRMSGETALTKVTGIPANEIHRQWQTELEKKYFEQTEIIRANAKTGEIILAEGTMQLGPEWSGDTLLYYLSNKGRDYYSQTGLYAYDVRRQKSRKLIPRLNSRVAVAPDGKTIYYSRASKPNRHGSVFYNIYRYDVKKRKEKPLTKNARAYNPTLAPDGKQMAFVTGRDGTGNVALMNLDTKEIRQVTDFTDGVEVFTLQWSPDGSTIAFDYMTGHGRDIALIDLADDAKRIFNEAAYDTRNPYFSPDGQWLYYASDETGIYNIYRQSLTSGERQLMTNVTGGAFMPAVNQNGELIYALLQDRGFKIALIENPEPIDPQLAVYGDYQINILPVSEVQPLSIPEPKKYHDQFAKMFILPRLLIDYGTVKPGFYFFSTEIINRFNIFGGASINSIKDRDLFLILEYHQWKPTFFLEFYNISRNIFNEKSIYKGWPVEADYTFYLTEAYGGVSHPLDGFNNLRFDLKWSRYRTSSDETIKAAEIYQNGFSYDYYRGVNFQLHWQLRMILPVVNEDTNPDNGFVLNTYISRNYDKFIEGFEVNNSYSTLQVDFRNNYYWKLEHEGNWYHKYPIFKKLTGNLRWRLGWISKPDLDSFFNFFAGGEPGLRGYPFYSLEGRNLYSVHYTWRLPLFREKHFQILSFNLQNAFVGTYIEAGNAWNRVSDFPGLNWEQFKAQPVSVLRNIAGDFKKDVGFQLRFSGFSFYTYPTSISLDWVYGLDDFQIISNSKAYQYGHEWRTYLTILFGL